MIDCDSGRVQRRMAAPGEVTHAHGRKGQNGPRPEHNQEGVLGSQAVSPFPCGARHVARIEVQLRRPALEGLDCETVPGVPVMGDRVV